MTLIYTVENNKNRKIDNRQDYSDPTEIWRLAKNQPLELYKIQHFIYHMLKDDGSITTSICIVSYMMDYKHVWVISSQ